ncbi:TPA: restriction endonuclease subunit S [Klebsiella pneumoniae]|uniref:restriction endonuclease subunit S n=1 Tax=Klebsiella pneumoniae TaxID=573 RepID=UPI000D65C5D1|nr:restriction endonuclease subunit S [Klebsiella pneumoniae]
MSTRDKSTLAPQLRFPEFRDAEEWTTCNLGHLSKIVTERVGNNNCIPYTITSGVGLISQQEKLGRTIAGNSLKNYILLQYNDFAYNKSATKAYPQGYIACYLGNESAAVPNSIFTCFRPDQNVVIPAFLDHLFSANLHGKWLKNRVAVGARANGALQVNNDDLMKVPVPLPTGSQSLSEQKKIADCLSSLDGLLAVEIEKIYALNKYKQGLMQQLFPQEGERIPRLRFPEFQGDGEWKEKKLGSLATKVGSGITPLGGEKNYKKSGRPFVRSQNIGWGELLLDDVAFIDEETHNSFIATQINLLDVFLNITGASIGRSAVADSRVVGGNVNQHVCIIRTTGELNPIFLNQFLISKDGQSQIDKCQAGGNRQGLNFSQIKSLTIPLPTDINEQMKIANVLASVDALVTSQNKKIEVLKDHKKGLIQQLFPVFGGASV